MRKADYEKWKRLIQAETADSSEMSQFIKPTRFTSMWNI